MGYGIEIRNADGNIIIDGTYKNFSLYESSSTILTGAKQSISFATPTTLIPIIAIKPDTSYVSLLGYEKSGNNWTGFTVIGTGTIYWKVYIAFSTSAGGSYGLICYDSSGNIVFDSNRECFKIYSVTTGISLANPDFSGGGGTQTITHAEIENPYYLWSPERTCAVSEYVPPWYHKIFKTGIKKESSTSAIIGWQEITQGSGAINYSESLTQKLIVLK